MVFALAEILSLKKLRQTDDFGSALGGFRDPIQGFLKILLGFWPARHLDQGHAEFIWRHALTSGDQYSIRESASRFWLSDNPELLFGPDVDLTAEAAEKSR